MFCYDTTGWEGRYVFNSLELSVTMAGAIWL